MSDLTRMTANRGRMPLSPEEINARELQAYAKGFEDGRANMMAEFLAALEEQLPSRKEAQKELVPCFCGCKSAVN